MSNTRYDRRNYTSNTSTSSFPTDEHFDWGKNFNKISNMLRAAEETNLKLDYDCQYCPKNILKLQDLKFICNSLEMFCSKLFDEKMELMNYLYIRDSDIEIKNQEIEDLKYLNDSVNREISRLKLNKHIEKKTNLFLSQNNNYNLNLDENEYFIANDKQESVIGQIINKTSRRKKQNNCKYNSEKTSEQINMKIQEDNETINFRSPKGLEKTIIKKQEEYIDLKYDVEEELIINATPRFQNILNESMESDQSIIDKLSDTKLDFYENKISKFHSDYRTVQHRFMNRMPDNKSKKCDKSNYSSDKNDKSNNNINLNQSIMKKNYMSGAPRQSNDNINNYISKMINKKSKKII